MKLYELTFFKQSDKKCLNNCTPLPPLQSDQKTMWEFFKQMYFKQNKLFKNDPCHLFCIYSLPNIFAKFHEICAMRDYLVTTAPS